MSPGSTVSAKPATNVVSMSSATQCAAVRIRSPPFESSTPAVQVCRSPAPRNSAPTFESGGTGAAAVLLGADGGTDARGSGGGAAAAQPAVKSTSPATSTTDTRMDPILPDH